MKYKKKQAQARITAQQQDAMLLGMLYVVEVRMVSVKTGEKIKQKLLLVGCEHADIERKLRWVFEADKYREFSISGIEKVREKVHVLSTVITQEQCASGPIIERKEADSRSQIVNQQSTLTETYEPKLYAVGIATTMLAKDEQHALRKVGHAIISSATPVASHSGASFSADSVVTVEEVPRSSGYAMPRDVSNEATKARLVRVNSVG